MPHLTTGTVQNFPTGHNLKFLNSKLRPSLSPQNLLILPSRDMSSYPNQLTPLPGPHFYQVQVVSAVQQPSTYTLVPLKTLNFPAPSLNRSPQHASLTSSSSPSPSPTPTSAAGESISSLASSPPVPRAQLQQRQDQAAMALFSHPQINPTLLAAYAPVPPTSSAAKSVPQLKVTSPFWTLN